MIDDAAAFRLGGPPAQVLRADADLMLMHFKAACLQGEVRFKTTEVAQIGPESVPDALRPSLLSSGEEMSIFYSPSDAPRRLNIAGGELKIFQLTVSKPAYFITFKASSPLRSYEYTLSCNMALQGIPLSYAWKVLTGVVYSETTYTRRGTSVRLGAVQTYPDADHLLSGQEIKDGYTLLQVATLNDRQRAEAQVDRAADKKRHAKPPQSFQISK